MWQPQRLTPEQLEERRLEAGRLLRAGQLSQAEIARHLGVSRTAVSRWAQRLHDGPRGLAALKNRPKSADSRGRRTCLFGTQFPRAHRAFFPGPEGR